MFKVFVALAAAYFVTPAVAQECNSIDSVIEVYKSQGDTILSDTKVAGSSVDRVVIDADKNIIWILLSKDGCVVGRGLPISRTIGPTDKPTPPAPKPKLRGGGLEIGA